MEFYGYRQVNGLMTLICNITVFRNIFRKLKIQYIIMPWTVICNSRFIVFKFEKTLT